MKKYIFTGILLCISFVICKAQDQTINGKLTIVDELSVGKNISGKWGEGIRLYFRGTDHSYDPIWLAKYTSQNEITDLRVNIGDGISGGDRFVVGTTQWDTKVFHEFFVVRTDGSIGIGIAQPKSKLDVNGSIRAKEVRIEATGWADFVFLENYKLPSLSEVESHIKENKHLPNIPSESEVKEKGISIGEMQAKLLQKIEELTLYVIEQNKKIEKLETENQEIKEQLELKH